MQTQQLSRSAARRCVPHIGRVVSAYGRLLHSIHPASSPAVAAAAAATPDTQQGAEQTASDDAPHIPVLLKPILEFFQPLHIRTYVDGTLGAGGHAKAVLQAHAELEVLVGIDVDPTAHEIAGARLRSVAPPTTIIHQVRSNYRAVKAQLSKLPGPAGSPAGSSLYGHVDAMLLDLGISSMQVDTAERGFSFRQEAPLDMRMDPTSPLTGAELVNTWSEAELGRIIRRYGEEKLWRVIARRIVSQRARGPIETTTQLVDAIGETNIRSKGKGRAGGDSKRIHPATRTFQAIRIAVNDEMTRLEQALPDAISALAPGGRLAVISFHSLEDRIVKRAFAHACGKPTAEDEHQLYGPNKFAFLDELEARAVAKAVTRKPVVPDADECALNPRSRSSKLRVIQRL